METIQSTTEPALFASRFINHTNKNIFLTGKAGTGKTTFLKQVVANTYKKCLIVAPTGIAAINAGGVTIHSLFQLPFGSFIPINQPQTLHGNVKINDPSSVIKNLQMYDSKRKLLRELELLIIDEVSMLRADLLDAIDLILRHVRRNGHAFGGVQILFIGDLLQLPPVVKDEEWKTLNTFYNSVYFFDAQVLQKNKPVYIELDKIYRQADNRFINLLNHLRNNEMTSEDYSLLNAYYRAGFKPNPADNYITLTTHNYKANELNKNFLTRLPGKSYYFEANIEGDFNEYAHPVEKTLELKIGAQVMFMKNDPTGNQRFFNGKIGVVSNIKEEEIEVKFNDALPAVIVTRYEWQNLKYKLNDVSNEIEENVAGTFTHYPIKLAWAITVHKSQGLTFDKAIIDIGDAFAPGQVYVALSRLRSLDGLILTSSVNVNSIQLDEKIHTYSKTQSGEQNLNELLIQETDLFLKNYLLRSFEFNNLIRSIEEHTDSYIKNEKKSVKQKHHEWAKELEKQLKELKPHSDKFKQQIISVIDNKEIGHLEFLHKRVLAAAAYFSPFFKSLSNKIFRHIELLKSEKKIKAYLSELFELEIMINEQHKLVNKSTFLIQATIAKTDISGEEIKKANNDPFREEQLKELLNMPAKMNTGASKRAPKERKPRVKNADGAKVEKIDTKTETFNLYKQGKTIEEIATLREMVSTTIEGHLAHYVAKGELDAKSFLPEEKIANIITVSKTLNTFQFGPIKQSLGDEYSYGEIKMAIASYLSTKEGDDAASKPL
ncbi:MAG: helix-turn-helix domain-containing protein [Bacteroidetes bacterium]|nr:helix-turn-helix domain-containing protein [Bacteroidota bacterium]